MPAQAASVRRLQDGERLDPQQGVELVGAAAIIGGIILLLIGLAFCATIIGAIIGIPLIIIALYVISRGTRRPAPPPVTYVQPQPMYYPPAMYQSPPPTPVVINNYQSAAPQTPPPPPQVMFRCRYCNSVYPETAGKCPSCGARF